MKIGVIYYSKTGNTAKLAEKSVDLLRQAGHDVDVWRLETVEPLSMTAERAAVKEIPDFRPYDGLAIGTPVHGGRISAPVLTFLEESPTFAEKYIAFFLTHFFSRKLSAHITIEALEKLGKKKGGEVLGSVDVTWFSINRKRQMDEAAKALEALFSGQN